MAEESIFFTEIPKKVRDIINGRSDVYAKKVRDTDAYQWLYQKSCWVEATCNNKVLKRVANLILPVKGGIGNQGLYTPVDVKNNVYIPDPHLNSIQISNIGDFGSVVTCQLDFSVYSLAQLNDVQAFFDIGASVTVNYGWHKAGNLAGETGQFNGKIYNFSYSLNTNGGFDCTTHAMGEGINVLGIKGSTSTTDTDTSYADGKTKKIASNLDGLLDYLILDNKNLRPGATAAASLPGSVYGVVFIGRTNLTTTSTEKTDPDTKNKANLYIRLDSFVGIVNGLFKKNKLKTANGLDAEIWCNPKVTKGPVFDGNSVFCSCEPTKIIFPGYWTLDTGAEFDDFTDGTVWREFRGDDTRPGFPGYTFISIDFIRTIIKETKDTIKQQKSIDQTIKVIFQKIFDTIYVSSGEIIKLTLTQVPEDVENENLKPYASQLIIAETATYNIKPTEIFEIKAVTDGSVCREMSMTTKVPQELQTAAFVVNSPGALESEESAGFARVFGTAGDAKFTKDEKQSIIDKVRSAAKALKSNYQDSNASSELHSALRQINFFNSFSGKNKRAIPFPIDLSVTLDGISGIVFGNTFTVNYLPSVYKENPNTVAFTVTKVDHNISNGDWTTTLSTVCRLIPDSLPESATKSDVNWRSELNQSISTESKEKRDAAIAASNAIKDKQAAEEASSVNEIRRTNNQRQII
jgi:hypothetical protein